MTLLIVGVIMSLSSVVTYNIIFSQTNELMSKTSREINKQIVLNYESYFNNVIDKSTVLQKEILDYTEENDLEALENIFVTSKNLNRNVTAISLLDINGKEIASSSSRTARPGVIYRDWFIKANEKRDVHYFSSPHSDDFFMLGKEVFSISRYVSYFNVNGVKANGLLLIEIDTREFLMLSLMTNLGEHGHIVITDNENKLVYSSLPQCDPKLCESLIIANDVILGGQLVTVNGVKMYVNVNTIRNTRWSIATFNDVDAISQTKGEVILIMSAIFMGTLVAVALSSSALGVRITKPMKKLENHIKKLEKGEFDQEIRVEGQKEVVILAKAFNVMSKQINVLMKRIIAEQNEKQNTQFIALQNQVNPHFLYNTLDAIVWLSENNKNRDVERAIIALSKFFRMSITSDSNLVKLKDELEHISSYLLIQQIRYQNSFVFEFEIEPSILECYVLKLSLQPLVENAIIHGIRPNEEFTKILIRGYEKDDHVYLEVLNEGYGISQDKIKELYQIIKGEQKSKSIGLKNTYQRLKLYYGEQAELYFKSDSDEHTTVTIKIPKKGGK